MPTRARRSIIHGARNMQNKTTHSVEYPPSAASMTVGELPDYLSTLHTTRKSRLLTKLASTPAASNHRRVFIGQKFARPTGHTPHPENTFAFTSGHDEPKHQARDHHYAMTTPSKHIKS